jgi:hypothetical protein
MKVTDKLDKPFQDGQQARWLKATPDFAYVEDFTIEERKWDSGDTETSFVAVGGHGSIRITSKRAKEFIIVG